jgi:hypothetical protein
MENVCFPTMALCTFAVNTQLQAPVALPLLIRAGFSPYLVAVLTETVRSARIRGIPSSPAAHTVRLAISAWLVLLFQFPEDLSLVGAIGTVTCCVCQRYEKKDR